MSGNTILGCISISMDHWIFDSLLNPFMQQLFCHSVRLRGVYWRESDVNAYPKHPTGPCEQSGVEESVEHVICVCQKYFNEREIMKKELRKVGVEEIKLKSIITCRLESLFLYFKRTGPIITKHLKAKSSS